MYITVKYGEKETALFNPNCRNISLLHKIRDNCQCEHGVEVELSDENGNVKYLRENPQRFANETLMERETLVLLQVNRPENGDTTYIPLLKDQNAITETFLSQLASKSNISRPPSTRKIRRAPARSPGSRSNTSDTSSKEKKTSSSKSTRANSSVKRPGKSR